MMQKMQLIKPAASAGLKRLIDLVFPPLCTVCDKLLTQNEDQICMQCLDKLIWLGDTHTTFSIPGQPFVKTAWVLFEFDEALQHVTHQLKYARRLKPIQVILEHYENAIRNLLAGHRWDWVLPIPLHPRKFRERGYNQAEGMAGWMAELVGAGLRTDLVRRVKYTRTQTQLNPSERLTNVQGAFGVIQAQDVVSRRILLVDDVLTTGATSNALAEELLIHGALQVNLVTLSTPKMENA